MIPDNTGSDAKSSRAGGSSIGFWLGLGVILVAATYIITSSMSHSLYYYKVNQVVGQAQLIGQTLRVQGEVVEGSHHSRRGALDDHVFLLSHDGATITVTYKGGLPDQFGDGVSVVATGVLSDIDLLDAHELTTQCPSRYQEQAPTSSTTSVDTHQYDGSE